MHSHRTNSIGAEARLSHRSPRIVRDVNVGTFGAV
jgi:hypothetical protein